MKDDAIKDYLDNGGAWEDLPFETKRKLDRLQKAKNDLFYTVYNWGQFGVSVKQDDSLLPESPTFKNLLKAYKDEVERLEKGEMIEKAFKEEAEHLIRVRKVGTLYGRTKTK